jgi:hypothetical protein
VQTTEEELFIMVFGSIGLMEYFFNRFPEYYLMPVRLLQDRVESFFSDLRGMAGGSSSMGAAEYAQGFNCVYNKRDCDIALAPSRSNVFVPPSFSNPSSF